MKVLDRTLEILECDLIEAEDAAARGAPGKAREAECLRGLLDDPAWHPVMEDLAKHFLKHGVIWGTA